MLTTEVENYPGFEEGILGPGLMEKQRKQAERFGTKFVEAEVIEEDFSTRPFKIATCPTNVLRRYLETKSHAELEFFHDALELDNML